MNKTWVVIKHEYRRHVLRKGFLLALFSIPLWGGISIGFGLLSVILMNNSTPIGYVDRSGFLNSPVSLSTNYFIVKDPEILPFTSEDQARLALNQGKIQAYYVLPTDYPDYNTLNVYFLKEPKGNVTSRFSEFLRLNLIKKLPKATATRLLAGANMEAHATEETRQSSGVDVFKIAAPIFGAMILLVAVFTSSGYLMQAIVDEKENRTMEILATSISPSQIMTGKVLALISVGFTQVFGWGLFALVGLLAAKTTIPSIVGVSIDWGTIFTILAMVIPTIIMMSALMAAIGATITEASEGSQVSSLVTLPIMIPFMLFPFIMSNPDSPLALFLTFFPPTSSMTVLLRLAFGTVPLWQVLIVTGVLMGTAVFSLYFAGRIFRVGMLRYGKRMKLKDVFMALRRTGG